MLFWILFAIIQLLFWGLIFQRLARYKTAVLPPNLLLPPVSIILCARNEATNLQKNLESMLLQEYSIFELIVVDDDSTDETAAILKNYQKKFPNLLIVTIKNKDNFGKKNALTQGLRAAQYDWVLLTDADCFAASNKWIQSMASTAITNQKDIVLGYGPYVAENTCLSKWVQFETAFVAIQYLSFALWKQPYMGVGRNLMYKKALFFDNNGFDSHQNIASGDDDLFVNEVATGANTSICLQQDSFMYSDSPRTWQKLYQQKTRHYSSSSNYKLIHQVLLGALSLSHFIFYLGIIVFLIDNSWNYAILVIIILRVFLFGTVFYKYLKAVGNLKLFLCIWVFDILIPIYYIIFAATLFGKKPQKWK